MNISVFGSGAWGTAIALLLHDNGHQVTLWSKYKDEIDIIRQNRENPLLKGVAIPDDIVMVHDLAEATRGAGALVIAVPSFAVRETVESLKGRIEEGGLIICMSKGIEKDTQCLFTDIIRSTLGDGIPISAVSGPTHAEEVSRRIPTACVAASEDIEIAERVQGLLMNENFRVYTSTDVIGVELGAALKNIIALSAGICDGLNLGDNTIATLITRGIAEMAELCVKMGGSKETLAGLAGLGDLIVTCMSRHSRNRRAGVLVGKGMAITDAMREVGAVVEGYYAAKAAYDMAAAMDVEMPICLQAYKVLYEGKSPYEAIRELMNRSRKSEQSTGAEPWVTM